MIFSGKLTVSWGRRLAGVWLILLFPGSGLLAQDATKERPNLLFIMTDQQRFDAMSCAGNTVIETPNMDRLAREGVMFTSDHGEMLGDHGMHSKMIFYEGSVHVPLLMRFPGRIQPGTVVEEPVSSMDLFPTILDYMGIANLRNNGMSLRTFIEGHPAEHDVVAYSTGRSTPNYVIRSGHLKLMIGQGADYKGIDALYDLQNDPMEMHNLILAPVSPDKNCQQAEMMKARLIDWLRKNEPHKAVEMAQRKLF